MSTLLLFQIAAAFLLGVLIAAGLGAWVLHRQSTRQRERAEAEKSTLVAQCQGAQAAADDWQNQCQQALRERDVSRQQLEHRDNALQEQTQRIERLAGDKEQLQRTQATLQSELAALKTELHQTRQNGEEKLQVLTEARDQLKREFETLANRIFEEKHDRFAKHSQSTLEGTLKPLREQLSDFRKKVEDVYEKDSRERLSLQGELKHLKELNQRMSDEALNLTRALKGDNKAQGNWGEVILERVLEESGLHKGREYETQVRLTGGDGRKRHPDVVVRLPEKKDIVIDAKVSLVDYERYTSAEDDTQRNDALRAHVASLRNHIASLSIKDYEDLDGIHSLDFVLIFVPIEAAFLAAFEYDPQLFRQAYDKNIIVVSPTTLLATLRTVQSIWRYERQSKNAEEIARRAGRLHDKFVGFIEDIDDVGRQLDKARDAHLRARNKLVDGRGNLISSTLKLEKLGAKVKKNVPESFLQQLEDAEGPADAQADAVPAVDADEQAD